MELTDRRDPVDPLREDPAEEQYRRERAAHWDAVAGRWGRRAGLGGAYHRRLERVYRFLVPPGSRVLEIGCGSGDLLAALRPAYGVGVDLSGELVRRAATRHPELRFVQAAGEELELGERFDYVVLSDLVPYVDDLIALFERVAAH